MIATSANIKLASGSGEYGRVEVTVLEVVEVGWVEDMEERLIMENNAWDQGVQEYECMIIN